MHMRNFFTNSSIIIFTGKLVLGFPSRRHFNGMTIFELKLSKTTIVKIAADQNWSKRGVSIDSKLVVGTILLVDFLAPL